MDEPVFPAGVTVPMRLTSMREVFHPSAGRNHSHWFYEFEPDRDQAVLMDHVIPPSEDDLETLLDRDEQKVVISPMRVGTTRPTPDLCVGDLFDVILVPREPIPIPEMTDEGMQNLLGAIFGSDTTSKVVAMVPLVDLEAVEYDLPPDIEGLPDLTHIDGGHWMNMSVTDRLQAIAEARREQR